MKELAESKLMLPNVVKLTLLNMNLLTYDLINLMFLHCIPIDLPELELSYNTAGTSFGTVDCFIKGLKAALPRVNQKVTLKFFSFTQDSFCQTMEACAKTKVVDFVWATVSLSGEVIFEVDDNCLIQEI